MSKKHKHKKSRKKETKNQRNECPIVIEYYTRPFILLHQELDNDDLEFKHFSRRQSFWRSVPLGKYNPENARPLLVKYLKALERDLSNLLSKQSIAYWLHLYRRLAPTPITEDKRPVTIYLVRAILEAGIMKYARFSPCNRVGLTSEVPIDQIMGGILIRKEFELEKNIIKNSAPQLVLTDFGLRELSEFYLIEKLCYEVWWSMAVLRGLGKGAPLIVEESSFDIHTAPSDELRKLIEIYDNRIGKHGYDASATGTVFFPIKSENQESGDILIPIYNVVGIKYKDINKLFLKLFKIKVESPAYGQFNFIWDIFELRNYYRFHKPFANGFKQKHEISLESVMAVIAALWCRVNFLWSIVGAPIVFRHWQKAYEGPYEKEFIRNEIKNFFPMAKKTLDFNDNDLHDLDLNGAIDFFTLSENKRSIIDIGYPGPHMIFLPFGSDRVFIDYAWISRRLYHLFWDVNIPEQKFKGDLLEMYVRGGQSILPIGPCKSYSGEERQIDAAFEVGDSLVIIECRAVGRAISFERGDPEAIKFRIRKINKALEKIDETATWLAQNPEGRNYNIKKFSYIIPIAITPFNEFIPSLDSKYWLTENLPRILTPVEFKEALEKDMLTPDVKNLIKL